MTGKSCNAYLSELALADLDRLESLVGAETEESEHSKDFSDVPFID
ncbi:MAG: hypothetical protein PUD20_09230 [bacterium]|nr:hypothetical protein [bacterium]